MGAMGQYVDSLTPKKEDRLLTTKLIPFTRNDENGAGCIVGVAEGCVERGSGLGRIVLSEEVNDAFMREARQPREYGSPEGATVGFGSWAMPFMFSVYNQAYFRFGPARLHHAIRMRILNNRARKQLPAPRREAVLA